MVETRDRNLFRIYHISTTIDVYTGYIIAKLLLQVDQALCFFGANTEILFALSYMTTRCRSAPPADHQHFLTRRRMLGLRCEDIEEWEHLHTSITPLQLFISRELAPAPQNLPSPNLIDVNRWHLLKARP